MGLPIVALLLVACSTGADELEPIERPRGKYAELLAVADRWREAVLEKRTEELVDYALPEDREVIRGDLNDSTSTLYGVLYAGPERDLLKKVEVETMLIPHQELEEYGMGTTVCFISPEVKRPSWPISTEELTALSGMQGVFCIFAIRAEACEGCREERWYVTYSFADVEEGDEE